MEDFAYKCVGIDSQVTHGHCLEVQAECPQGSALVLTDLLCRR